MSMSVCTEVFVREGFKKKINGRDWKISINIFLKKILL